MEPTPANIYLLDLSPEDAVRIHDRLNAAARRLRRAGGRRSINQLRADVAVDVLLADGEGAGSVSRGGTVRLTTDLATLAEPAEQAGALGGCGPVIADIARQVAENTARSRVALLGD